MPATILRRKTVMNKSLYMLTIPGLPPVLALWTQERDGYLCFFDTVRGHMLEGEMVSQDENSFIWKWVPGGNERGLIIGRRLTLELYDEVLRPTITGDVPVFKTTEALTVWYYKQFDNWRP
jgi:hypothetical protein